MVLPRVTNLALHSSFHLNNLNNLRVLLLSNSSNNLHRRVQNEINRHEINRHEIKRHGPVKQPALKLQSVSALPFNIASNLEILAHDCEFSDIRVIRNRSLCYIHFDFYNGAMDKVQGIQLKSGIENKAKCADVRMPVLMGGDRFFSTGIHLCSIEANEHKYSEGWTNSNMINDVIKAMVTIPGKLVVAALQGNAGAGGTMLAAAADIVVSHPEIFTDLDKDGNKSISKEEFLQEMMLPHRRETLKAEFMKLCNPVTKKMRRAEVAKMCQATKTYSNEDIEKILQEADINGDGQIDLDEFLAACS